MTQYQRVSPDSNLENLIKKVIDQDKTKVANEIKACKNPYQEELKDLINKKVDNTCDADNISRLEENISNCDSPRKNR